MFIQFELKYHFYFGEGLIVAANLGMQAEVTKFGEITSMKPCQPVFTIFNLFFLSLFGEEIMNRVSQNGQSKLVIKAIQWWSGRTVL